MRQRAQKAGRQEFTQTQRVEGRSSSVKVVCCSGGVLLAALTFLLLSRHSGRSIQGGAAAPRAIVLEKVVDGHGDVIAAVLSEDKSLSFLVSGASVVGAKYVAPEFQDQSAFTGFAVQEAVLFAKRSLKSVLQLGLGAGIVPSWLRRRGVRVDVVEYSERILSLAEKHFGFHSCCTSAAAACGPKSKERALCEKRAGRSTVQEARDFVFNYSGGRYDVVISDCFSGSNPGHLHSKEVFEHIKRSVLKEGGILVVNFVGLHKGRGSETARILARTLRNVFAATKCYRDQSPDLESDTAANLICFASDEVVEFMIPVHDPDFTNPDEYSSFWVMKNFPSWEVLQSAEDDPHAEIYTDARNSLLDPGAQAIIEAQLWRHAQDKSFHLN